MNRTETEASDAELLAAVPTDIAALEVFYRRYVRRVTGFAARRCTTADDVADVVAQTFINLLHAAERYDPDRGEAASFLFGIAANVVRNYNREEARQRALVLKAAGCALLDSDDIERIDTAIDAAHRADRLAAAVDGVPPAEQELLWLVARGRTPGQAAGELGISPGAARTRLSRARTRMRNHLTSTKHTRSEHEQ